MSVVGVSGSAVQGWWLGAADWEHWETLGWSIVPSASPCATHRLTLPAGELACRCDSGMRMMSGMEKICI